MNDDELPGGGSPANGGRFSSEPDDDDDGPEGNGCAGSIAGCALMVVLLAIVALAMWLFWPGGGKP